MAEPTTHESLVRCISRIYARGWCEGTAGNYSVTLDRSQPELLITRSGIDKGRICVDDLLVLGPDNTPIEGDGLPSAESRLHLAIVRSTGAGAVLHTHSVWGTLLGEQFLDRGGLTLRGYEMLKGLDGIDSHECAYHLPIVANTQDIPALADQVTTMLAGTPRTCGFLIAGHGLYTWGPDLASAYRHVEIFEFLFQLVGRRLELAKFTGE